MPVSTGLGRWLAAGSRRTSSIHEPLPSVHRFRNRFNRGGVCKLAGSSVYPYGCAFTQHKCIDHCPWSSASDVQGRLRWLADDFRASGISTCILWPICHEHQSRLLSMDVLGNRGHRPSGVHIRRDSLVNTASIASSTTAESLAGRSVVLNDFPRVQRSTVGSPHSRVSGWSVGSGDLWWCKSVDTTSSSRD